LFESERKKTTSLPFVAIQRFVSENISIINAVQIISKVNNKK